MKKIKTYSKSILALVMSMALILPMTGCGALTGQAVDAKGQTPNVQVADKQTDGAANALNVVKTDDQTDQVDDSVCRYAGQTPEEILSQMTLDDKAAQMVMPAVYNLGEEDIDKKMESGDYGAVLSKFDSLTYKDWTDLIEYLQRGALRSKGGIPFIYGQDDVHGVNYAQNTVIFPHNIGLGAANDEKLMTKIGEITADEAKMCHMLWNYAPCVAQSVDPRWGRTYESYGSDLKTITKLSTAYTRALVKNGIIACTKHFIGDGNVKYGTGECSDTERLIDRGDAMLSDAEIDKLMDVYKEQVKAGAQTIMISHSSVNGVKMHENGELIRKFKKETGFKGFIASDWNSVQNTSASDYESQIVNAINAGIDMLMEVDRFDEAIDCIKNAVNSGRIEMARIDEAVLNILRVKKDAGVIDDPLGKNIKTKQKKPGSATYRKVAREAVQKSLVLLKNNKVKIKVKKKTKKQKVLPIKKGTKVYIMGPAANDVTSQCGGWTLDWNSIPDGKAPGVTTIKKGFAEVAKKKGIKIVNSASKADVILLCVGEQSYAEWNGDTEDLKLCGMLGLKGNASAIKQAGNYRKKGKAVVACIVAGRNVIIKNYEKNWDGIVMCYLPGSEGAGVADVLCGVKGFTGKLPSPWYSDINQIGTGKSRWKRGYGLK